MRSELTPGESIVEANAESAGRARWAASAGDIYLRATWRSGVRESGVRTDPRCNRDRPQRGSPARVHVFDCW